MTVEPCGRSLPSIDNNSAPEPAGTDAGLTERSDSGRELTVNVWALDETPPGRTTLTEASPGRASRLAGIGAVICVALTMVAGRVSPFQRRTDPLVKPVPVTVRTKPLSPAVAEGGLSSVIRGAAFSIRVTAPEISDAEFT